MEPATYNFTIYQGKTFERQMTLKDAAGKVIDLSDYLARMTIRRTHGSAALLSLTQAAGGGITVAATSPNLTLKITAAQTAALNFEFAIYDLEIESPGGTVDALLEGRITFHKEVTT